MGKNQHSKDRMFITATEWAAEYGGHKLCGNQSFTVFSRCAAWSERAPEHLSETLANFEVNLTGGWLPHRRTRRANFSFRSI